jgi:hypothetical protein
MSLGRHLLESVHFSTRRLPLQTFLYECPRLPSDDPVSMAVIRAERRDKWLLEIVKLMS